MKKVKTSEHPKRFRNSVVVVVTRYALDGSGFEPRWDKRSLPYLVNTVVGRTRPAVQSVPSFQPLS
jgi:hypothetical protein